MKPKRQKLDTVTLYNVNQSRSARVHRRQVYGRGPELGVSISIEDGVDAPRAIWMRRGQARRLRDAITKWLEVIA